MPIDDTRTRTPAPRPVAADESLADELGPTPQRLAEIEAAQIAEAVRRLKDIREGREEVIAWEDVEASLLDLPTPD